MSTVIERAKAEAEREYPFDYAEDAAYVAGATFAATITPEQIEEGARGMAMLYHEWDTTTGYVRENYRNKARAAFRAAGFVTEEGS